MIGLVGLVVILILISGVHCTDHEDNREEADHNTHSGSCSSPEERSYDGEEYSYFLEITDESPLDGEVGKRLNQIIPAPVSATLHIVPIVVQEVSMWSCMALMTFSLSLCSMFLELMEKYLQLMKPLQIIRGF